MNADNQSEVFSFLARPETYGPGVAAVERIETHAAVVFLVGDHAYKVKRAVSYPYLDFSSLEKRASFCHREVELNKRTAPDLYLGVVSITRHEETGLALAGKGEVVEWAVHMKRFPQEALLEEIVLAGNLTLALCQDIAKEIATFHKTAEPIQGESAPDGFTNMKRVMRENIKAFSQRRDLFASQKVATFEAQSKTSLDLLGPLLRERAAKGFLRQCHGDLHLANICRIDEQAVLFDCIEFNDDIAQIDVLYDIAFLLMDLEFRDLGDKSNYLLNCYLIEMGSREGLEALPFFLSQRAAVRAQVSAQAAAKHSKPIEAQRLKARAKSYFSLAQRCLKPKAPRLIAIGGFSGCGKTTIARGIAARLGPMPGAIHLRSDQLRKELFGADELSKLPQSAYASEVNARVYALMLGEARKVLKAGYAVILDAGHRRRQEREAAQDLAEELGIAFQGFWLDLDPEQLAARIKSRTSDASDATLAVLEEQLRKGVRGLEWPKITTDRPVDKITADLLSRISASD